MVVHNPFAGKTGRREYVWVLMRGSVGLSGTAVLASLFLVTPVMATGTPSSDLKVEDCDWLGQADQKAIGTAP